MALPKRCVNNEIALKKINFRFLDKYEKVYFHGEEKDPTKRTTTKSYIIGGGQRRCVIAEVGLRAQNRSPFRGPHQLHVPDALPGSGTPRSGTFLSSRKTSTTLPESTANSSKTILIEAGNMTIVLHCCRESKPPSGTVLGYSEVTGGVPYESVQLGLEYWPTLS
ncbi:uncharacterized protein LOC128093511 [Culex pipiens pallens]|uniref:uncharacterized protein LOC128093511 n=1 Tax=Culex pipiens pallens TaxID=42434 RepID=UPI0022AA9A9B|nr:uncharacterized protein LOC128093511 [Culex pipiens pallens]XP_052566539.1 uncharacterized protein LOC128093511 [Culex pipiens pallens]